MLQNKSIWLLAFVFFVVGALFCMNDVIFPYAKDYFGLSYFQATLIQLTFYFVYLPFPFWVSRLVDKYGYKLSVVSAIVITVTGCLTFYISYIFSSFSVLLGAIFIISTGIMILNVAANPYATLLGPPEQSQLRINFVQVFSRIGYAITPVLGNYLVGTSTNDQPLIYLPYLLLAIVFVVLLFAMKLLNMPSYKDENIDNSSFSSIIKKAFTIKQLYWGALAMFFYVGAEACTASFFINYCLETKANMSEAGIYLSWYYILAGVGGFAAIYILKYVSAGKVIGVFSGIIVMLVIMVIVNPSYLFPFPMILIGFFLAALFPTIFGMAIEGLGGFTNQGSALVSIAIAGGALFPPLQGLLADNFSVHFSYIVPAFCFLMISIYGITSQSHLVKRNF